MVIVSIQLMLGKKGSGDEMIERIQTAMAKCGIAEYYIEVKENSSVQLYFIKKSLDMKRMTEEKIATVSVYKAFADGDKKFRGVSEVQIQESMTDAEIEKVLAGAFYAAGFVKNRYYDLYQGAKLAPVAESGSLADKTLSEIALGFAEALFAEDTQEKVFINSAEIFAEQETKHIVSSSGVDVAYAKKKVSGEFVVQCVDGQDVETYQSFAYDAWNTDALRDKVKNVIDMTQARAKAVKAPAAGNYRVILSGNYVKDVVDYYVGRSSSGMIYPKYSSYEVGCKVQGDEVAKEYVNVTLKAKEPFSTEGIPMKDLALIADGQLKKIHGGNRFAQYLGIEPTGNYGAFAMPAGDMTMEQMKSEPYLEVVNFSDFQMDTLSGYFGGEIRLGFLYDGKTVTPVTGGSINGNILEAQKSFVFSKEMQTELSFEGPKAIMMDNISVAGE